MQGQFVPPTLAEILRDLYLSEQSGVLTLSRTEVRKRIYFDRGMIFFADSCLEDEGLLDLLIHNRHLDVTAAAEFADQRGDDQALSRRILASRRIDPSQLHQSIRELIEQVIVSTFRWDSGEYVFREGLPRGEEPLPTDVIVTFGYLMRGIRSMTGFGPIREAMLRLDRVVKMNEALYLPMDKLALHPIQGFILSRVDGSSRIREIASLIPPSEEDATFRFLFGLLLLGMVQTSPPLGSGALRVQELLAGDRESREKAEKQAALIRTACHSLSTGTPWQILAVECSATPAEVRSAYETRKEAFQPSRFLKTIQEAYREDLMLIERRFLEAYLALAEGQVQAAKQQGPGTSETVKLDLETLSQRKELTKTQTQELVEEQTRRAEEFYLKAREYFRSKDYHNAIQYCELALKAQNGDARYHLLLGQSLMRNPDYRWQKRAEESLLRAAEIDPWNASYFVHLGNFYRAHNLLRKAKKNFQRAAEMMPSHPEAQKALQDLKNVEV